MFMTPIFEDVAIDHKKSWITKDIGCPALQEEPAVTTVILGDKYTAKRASQREASEKEANVCAGVWMWLPDCSHSNDHRVGRTAVSKHGTEWRTCHRYLGTGCMEVIDAALWAIGLGSGRQFRRENNYKSKESKWW